MKLYSPEKNTGRQEDRIKSHWRGVAPHAGFCQSNDVSNQTKNKLLSFRADVSLFCGAQLTILSQE
ncbi:MAG: hypothetical protein K2Y28_12565 [Burkholderiaceae bacterium]|nr:hypothetical protein [Burkholderiaceae bacterium]